MAYASGSVLSEINYSIYTVSVLASTSSARHIWCAVAAIVGNTAFGSFWGFPLADLVWWFDVLMLAVGLASTSLATVPGTPGCEIGVLRELPACLRGTPAL
jgi:hypothetical protein